MHHVQADAAVVTLPAEANSWVRAPMLMRGFHGMMLGKSTRAVQCHIALPPSASP